MAKLKRWVAQVAAQYGRFRNWWYELGWTRSWQLWVAAAAVMYFAWPAWRDSAIPVFFGFAVSGLGLLYVASRIIIHRRTHTLEGDDLAGRENSILIAMAIIIAGAMFAT